MVPQPASTLSGVSTWLEIQSKFTFKLIRKFEFLIGKETELQSEEEM